MIHIYIKQENERIQDVEKIKRFQDLKNDREIDLINLIIMKPNSLSIILDLRI